MKLALATLLLIAGAALAQNDDLAVIVNKANTIDNVTAAELRSIALGDKAKWPDGRAVIRIVTPPESNETASMLRSVYHMSDAALRRYYLLAAFNGKEIMQAKEAASAAAAKQLVAQTPGAIACIRAADVDSTVKVVKVDGVAPGDSAYKLR